ncbi:hypothetical protein TNCV_4171121 [Trichonephila clavipes]|nr:hypothetical protein TNCV_4171121 [Trichonephila clavipes]
MRASSTHLTEDVTFISSDIIDNLVDYEDGEEELDSLKVDKIHSVAKKMFRETPVWMPRRKRASIMRIDVSGYLGVGHLQATDQPPLGVRQNIQCHHHKETTDRSWLEEPTSAKTLTTVKIKSTV